MQFNKRLLTFEAHSSGPKTMYYIKLLLKILEKHVNKFGLLELLEKHVNKFVLLQLLEKHVNKFVLLELLEKHVNKFGLLELLEKRKISLLYWNSLKNM